jgi:hypothetical protein
MVNLNQNNDDNSSKISAQFTRNFNYTQINRYKNSAERDNVDLLDNDSNQMLRIFHQNICGLGSKTIDLLAALYPNLPHILCLSEHHLSQFQLQHITMDDYILGAAYSRQSLLKGGGFAYLYKNTYHFR